MFSRSFRLFRPLVRAQKAACVFLQKHCSAGFYYRTGGTPWICTNNSFWRARGHIQSHPMQPQPQRDATCGDTTAFTATTPARSAPARLLPPASSSAAQPATPVHRRASRALPGGERDGDARRPASSAVDGRGPPLRRGCRRSPPRENLARRPPPPGRPAAALPPRHVAAAGTGRP